MAEPSIGSGLVVVGAASRDLDRSDPRGWRLGGTVSYAALAAARLGCRVRALVGADDLARGASELDVLRQAGVEIQLVELDRGPVFENLDVGGDRVQTAHHVSAAIRVTALPNSWRESAAVLLGPVADELGDEWSDAFDRDALVAVAWQGLLRELRAGEPVRRLPLARSAITERADVLFVSAEDAAGGGAPLDELLRQSQQLAVTHGGHGAAWLRRAAGRISGRYVPARPRRHAIDSTGAGDVFIGAYLAARLARPQLVGTAEEWRLHAVAAAAASLNVTGRTLAEVPSLRDICAALVTPPA